MLDPDPANMETTPVRRTAGKTPWKKLLSLLSGFFVPLVALIALLLLYRDSKTLFAQEVKFDYRLLIIPFVLQWSGFLLSVYTWRKILRAFGVTLPYFADLKIYVYSSLGWIIPGAIWPFLMRPSLYAKRSANPVSVAASILVEMLTVGIGAFILYSIITIFEPQLSVWKNPYVGYVLVIFAFVIIHPRIINKLFEWIYRRTNPTQKFPAGKYNYINLMFWTFLQIVVLVVAGISEFYLLKSITPTQTEWILPVMTAWAVATLTANLLFFFPGASILKDGATVLILNIFLSMPTAILFVIFARVWTIVWLLVTAGGVYALFDLPDWIKRRKMERQKGITPLK